MSFFRAFWGTCCGTEIFRKLRDNFWLKTLWHLILMCVCCSVLIGVGNYYSMKYRWRAAESGFVEGFGHRLVKDPSGIRPEIAPGTSRRQEFPYNSLLIYVSPEGAEKNYPEETLVDRNVILLWHPSCFALALRDHDKWMFAKFNSDANVEIPSEPLSFQEMQANLLAEINSKKSGNWKWRSETLTTGELFKQFRLIFAQVQALQNFFFIFAVLLFSLIFSVFFRLVSAKKQPGLTFGKLWNVVVYASFPVLLVVSAFPALQLPGTHLYMPMFVAGWMTYVFFILRAMFLAPDDEDENKDESVNEHF